MGIKDEWIIETVTHPLGTEIQRDGRIRKWSYITEKNKYLWVIHLEDGETVPNVFYDRRFAEEPK